MRATSQDETLATRASLLARLKDWENQSSWQDFVDTYWQLLYRVGLKAGLTDAEAQDAVQETVLAVARNIKNFQYDPDRCAFKTWLMLIARQRILWQLKKRMPGQQPRAASRDDTARTATVEKIADPNAVDLDAVWEVEWQQNLMTAALQEVRKKVSPRQFQIFDLYVLRNWPAREVARTLRISVTQVYLAKHRISALLKMETKKWNEQANSSLRSKP